MKISLISGVAAAAVIIASTGAIASDSFKNDAAQSAAKVMKLDANGAKPGGHHGGPKPGMGGGPKPGWGGGPKPGMGNGPKPGWNGGGHMGPKPVNWNNGGHRWGNKVSGKWHGGWKAPGGWNSYKRPYRGYVVNSYWVNPGFALGNYWTYGLSAPSNGYYWSRYYDDAVLMNNQGYVSDYRSDINWDQYEGGYASAPETYNDGYYETPDYGPAMRPDTEAYDFNDGQVGFAAPDGSRYTYDGGWVEGEFVDPAQRVWEGEWEGRVIREGGKDGYAPAAYPAKPTHHAGAPYAPPQQSYAPPPQAYHVPPGYEGYEKCLKSNGVTGGVIGAIIGGFAGNQIAGRGDKLGGTLLGAGLGGLAGVAVEKATSKCKNYHPGYREPVSYAPPPQHYPPQYQQQQYAPGYYPPTYQSGYYYPAPQITTVTVVPGSAVTTTTTTEEYYYETVPVKKWKPAQKKVWKPKPKPRCSCR